jgi:hypothetical protein
VIVELSHRGGSEISRERVSFAEFVRFPQFTLVNLRRDEINVRVKLLQAFRTEFTFFNVLVSATTVPTPSTEAVTPKTATLAIIEKG